VERNYVSLAKHLPIKRETPVSLIKIQYPFSAIIFLYIDACSHYTFTLFFLFMFLLLARLGREFLFRRFLLPISDPKTVPLKGGESSALPGGGGGKFAPRTKTC
jgi:hypothetical protein